MFSNFSIFKLPLCNTTFRKVIPKALLLTSLIPNNSLLCKNVVENICKSVIVLSTYPLEEGDKVTVEKYDGILKNYNFWFLTLKKKNSTVYIPTSRVYNTIYEIHD